MKQILFYVNILISVLRNTISPAVVEVIKEKIFEAATHGDWADLEKTKFVVSAARDIAKASSNEFDDHLVEILVKLYVKKYRLEGKL